MKKIKIKFSGMAGNFNPENNFIMDILREKYIVELSDTPDYLFYSVNSKDYLNYKCVRIFFTAENLVPDFNICDYGIGFCRMNFGDRYIRYPLYLVDGFAPYAGDDYVSDLQRALTKHMHAETVIAGKTGFCAFVYSNSEAARCREKLFRALSSYKQVDSGGRYLNNVGGPIDNKYEFQKKYKFVIAFENTSTPGYTTEKIVHAFSAGSVPIYWGNPQISSEFNCDSFVNCNDFSLTEEGNNKTIRRIVEHIKEIDNNDDLFRKMIETPAFSVENDVGKQKIDLKNFIYNIIDQPLKTAFRRNRYYWGERYERKQKIGNSFYWKCRKFIPMRNGIRKLLKKR